MVERVWLCVGALGPEHQTEPRYQVAYYTYLASGRQLLYTPSVERVVGWRICVMQPVTSANFLPFSDYIISPEKRYQALPAFPYCKRWKAGQGLGTRLHLYSISLVPKSFVAWIRGYHSIRENMQICWSWLEFLYVDYNIALISGCKCFCRFVVVRSSSQLSAKKCLLLRNLFIESFLQLQQLSSGMWSINVLAVNYVSRVENFVEIFSQTVENLQNSQN